MSTVDLHWPTRSHATRPLLRTGGVAGLLMLPVFATTVAVLTWAEWRPERLGEWEQMMTERVGLAPPSRDGSDVHAQARPIRSVSFCCESLYCGCDCDEV